MKRILLISSIITLLFSLFFIVSIKAKIHSSKSQINAAISLSTPQPSELNRIISQRRSTRSFKSTPLTIQQISQLLWAGQGMTDLKNGFRATPSAGALYPIKLYLIKENKIWLYLSHKQQLQFIHQEENIKIHLAKAAYGQSYLIQAPILIIITGTYKKEIQKYGQRGIQFTHLEAGHTAQNILLETTALKLAAVPIGGFSDSDVKKVLRLPADETPFYLIPIGYANTP